MTRAIAEACVDRCGRGLDGANRIQNPKIQPPQPSNGGASGALCDQRRDSDDADVVPEPHTAPLRFTTRRPSESLARSRAEPQRGA